MRFSLLTRDAAKESEPSCRSPDEDLRLYLAEVGEGHNSVDA